MKGTLAVLLPVAAVLALGACGLQSGLPRGAVYIPSDAAFVLSFDLPALVDTDLYRELEEKGGAIGLNRINFLKFASVTGMDPAKDVRWLTFVGRTPEGEAGPAIDELSAVVSGTFDGRKTLEFLRESGMPSEEHEGLEIFQMVIVEGRCRFCIAILDDTTAAFGDGETLRAMAEGRRDRERTLPGDPMARRLLGRVDSRAAIWGLARGRNFAAPFATMLQRMAGAESEDILSPVKDLSFFVATGSTVTVAVDAVAGNEEDALLVADILEGAGAVGRLALKRAGPEASTLLTTFKVQVDGPLLRASTSFPQATLLDLAHALERDVFGGGPFGFPFARPVTAEEEGGIRRIQPITEGDPAPNAE